MISNTTRAFLVASLAVTALHLVSCASASADSHGGQRFVLTDSSTNTHLRSFGVSAGDLGLPGTWSIRKDTLQGGKQDGVDLITVDNGKMTIRVIPTRGMSILDIQQGDVRLGWDSPVKEIVHPKYIDLDSRGGLGWLDGFNEWMCRCGLEFAGHPGKDEFTTNTGATATMDLSLHGKIGNIPASQVEIIIDKEAPHRIRVRGVVHERLFFGPKLELVAEVSTVPGSDVFQISDTVTNLAGGDQEFTVIYHGNYGRPILEGGATVHVPAKRVRPMNEHAAKAVESYATYKAPTPGFIEEVFLVDPYSDASGTTSILLQNKAGDRATSVTWKTAELPYLTIWKNTTSEADGYVTGLEPGTTHPYNRKVEREAGRLPVLKAGETRRFTLDFGIHLDKASVDKARSTVDAIRAGRETKIEKEAPKI